MQGAQQGRTGSWSCGLSFLVCEEQTLAPRVCPLVPHQSQFSAHTKLVLEVLAGTSK